MMFNNTQTKPVLESIGNVHAIRMSEGRLFHAAGQADAECPVAEMSGIYEEGPGLHGL